MPRFRVKPNGFVRREQEQLAREAEDNFAYNNRLAQTIGIEGETGSVHEYRCERCLSDLHGPDECPRKGKH